ncbi:stage IV sporulation protein A [Clostridium botulinum]|uniref:Stage IV sporulation protein A n=2 Tax=Clostridium botulinum TaxID=1491 RepID=A0A846HYR5_CLOBO|nr:stage IV sporulation protein A [Clostridium botulinum]AJD27212.1 stage IV sporulation protein A [Clostridium botulinum CDC_297]EPS52293.1 stage IV sporulation protein A [Clostridium botulinum A1 str. CFSAN002368]ACQ52788.1 stage IV sporulation protein A [Clostridium botulinum Ba4 str. 657]AJE09708.1 stage IV sporulation protein A [Clostridium botulinum CDC_1436]APQ99498.1 stage IV sporulation protein A [Clostridium botulinum]
MDNFDIYKDIAERTQGDIYVGVVGPVRTGKSTFIKKFMEKMVIPKIENSYKKQRAKDELPQSSSGKAIHTTEPKFVPNEAVEVSLENDTKFKVRMVDCVGYIVNGALGYMEEEDKPKMVTTPWYDYEIPFEEAAEIGTKKVINEHSTIGLLITTDGSITDIDRENYVEVEERVVEELKSINKPFIIVLNSSHPYEPETIELRTNLEEKYDVPVQTMDILNMKEEDMTNVFQRVLKEFPIKEVNIDMPAWIEELKPEHWLKTDFINVVKNMAKEIYKVRDIKKSMENLYEFEFLDNSTLNEMNMGEGTARIALRPKDGLFYKIIGEVCNREIENENDLLKIVETMNKAKIEYDRIAEALEDVKETGYGLVAPQLTEMKLEEPEIVKQGSRYGVKLKASAPSLHFIRADIETEVSPIMGTEKESEEMLKSLLEEFETDPSKIWQSNMFGKSLEVLVKEGLQNKLYRMPEDVQVKIQKTLQKIINEGNGGLICIIL